MKRIIIYFISMFFIFNISCANESLIEIKEKNKGSMQISFDKKSTPKEIAEVMVFLTRKEFDTKKYSLDLVNSSEAKITIKNITIGFWHITVHALNSKETIIYSGETDVNVQPSATTPIVLELNPTTGSIDLTVTWGSSGSKLVAYYPFYGNAKDYSGFDNDGFVYGAKLTQDRFGNKNSAYYFNGIDNYIRIADNQSLTPSNQKLTIAAWIKNDSSRNKAILYKGNRYNNREYALGINDSTFAGFSINNYGMWHENQIGLGSITKIKNNKWYFITATWNGTQMKIYVNGKLENSKVTDARIGDFDSDLFIGTYGGEKRKYAFKGTIDDITIFNRVLSSEEIEKIYNTTK